MRTRSKVLIAIGAVLAVLAGVWAVVAPGQLVKYPNDLDKTAVATGKFSLFLHPGTGDPYVQPQVLPLTINRRLHVTSSNGAQAVVKEDSVEKIGSLPQQNLQQQYVIDRGSLKNLASSKSYAYTAANGVDRSPAYSINLPFDTGAGPYQVWKNEVGRSYAFRRQGASFTRDGVTLIPLEGQLSNAPAQDYYLAQLRSLGLPTETTLPRLAPQLKALGLDPAQLSTTLLPQLNAGDRAAIESALAQPIGLRYVVSVRTRLLVEPTTGAIVSLDRINQTLGVQPKFAALTEIGAILNKAEYRTSPVIRLAGAVLAKLAKSPPTVRVFNINYGQTPASVADIASYANSKADSIDMVKTTIPIIVLLIGVLSAAIGLIMWLLDRRGQGEAPGGPPPAREPVDPATAPKRPTPSTTIPRTRGGERQPGQPAAPRGSRNT
jgi:Porin PorA